MLRRLFTRKPRHDWRVWSTRHAAYWRGNRCGYTTDILQAGLYTEAEARSIAADPATRSIARSPGACRGEVTASIELHKTALRRLVHLRRQLDRAA